MKQAEGKRMEKEQSELNRQEMQKETRQEKKPEKKPAGRKPQAADEKRPDAKPRRRRNSASGKEIPAETFRLDEAAAIADGESRIEGRNAVTEAFKSGRTIDRLYVLDGCQDGPVLTIKREAAKAGTPIRYISRERLDQLSETGRHQGVIAVCAAYSYASMDDLFARAQAKDEDPFFILLDNIVDPHNLGAIIRTANAVGAHGVIIPKDRAVGLTATVAKASAGALNYTPVVKVTNMVQTIEALKKKGLWFVCADMDGEPMTRLNLTGPIGMIVGAEGSGVSRLVKEHCDTIASIPLRGEINSLNASVAAGVLAYEILRQRLSM